MTELPFRPMLAAKAPSSLAFPLFASPKIDGIRALIREGRVLSRSGKEIPNRWCGEVLGSNIALEGLDGELTVGPPNAPNVMQATTSGLMTREGRPSFTFHVFDYYTRPREPFQVRYNNLRIYFEAGPGWHEVAFLPQVVVENSDELAAYEAECLAQGYEGVMLRSPDGLYKFGRSTAREGYLMKLKRFVDGEARVVGVVELMRNANELTTDELGYAKRSSHKDGKIPGGVLGALTVEDLATGIRFDIGTGFTAEQRANLWRAHTEGYRLVGMIAKYKHFAVTGVKEAPRFPVFLGFRHPDDMS